MKVILELFYTFKDIGEFIKTLHLLHPYLLPNGIAASESQPEQCPASDSRRNEMDKRLEAYLWQIHRAVNRLFPYKNFAI